MALKPLLPHQRQCGWLASHTQEDGIVEIPLTGKPEKDALLRSWATGKGRFVVEEFTSTGQQVPFAIAGDAWEAPTEFSQWVQK